MLLGALALTPIVSAQSASEPALKAAFLFNFAKFTDWPATALAADAPFLMCVIDGPVADALEMAAAGRSVGSRPVSVARVAADPAPKQCAVLYVSALDDRRLTRLIAGLADTSVLSVGDTEDFTKRGGIVHFFVEAGQMRFAVNVAAAERAHLQLSSKLLSLARIVRN
jgi:hypothetical protein